VGTEVKLEGVDYLVIRESDLLAIVVNDANGSR
jgi:co-chaperonin GroES (HSP10)